MRYLSVCSGIEAATVAWHPLGWTPIGFAEIDVFPSRVLAHHYGSNLPSEPPSRNGVPNFGDFTTIDLGALGPVDLLVGGTPCQAFSVAGKRLSLADARGNLSLAYAVLAHELAGSHGLRWAVWENVPGVLSTGDNAFGCFLGALVGGDDPVEPVARPKLGRSNAFWRWRKAGIEADDDGNDVEVAEGHVTRWPSAGMAAGPLGRAAWRVLDAQYFGLAQRRRRVFVVAGLGDGTDPAAVLFEPHGLRRHPPSRGKAGQNVTIPAARGVALRGREGGGAIELGDEVSFTLRASGGGSDKAHVLTAFGGNNTAGPIDVATAVTAHGGLQGRQNFESETFVTHALRADGFDASEDSTGRGSPLVPIAFDCKAGGKTGLAVGDIPGALRGVGHGGGHAAIAFDTTQITHPENRSNPQPGDPCHPLAAAGHVPSIAYALRSDAGRHGEATTPSADATGRMRLRDPGFNVCEELAPTLDAGTAHTVNHGWAVRRLMPVETERLQGFPDGYTAIPGAADGPRYKTHGNSMAVNVMRWIGERIASADPAACRQPTAPAPLLAMEPAE